MTGRPADQSHQESPWGRCGGGLRVSWAPPLPGGFQKLHVGPPPPRADSEVWGVCGPRICTSKAPTAVSPPLSETPHLVSPAELLVTAPTMTGGRWRPLGTRRLGHRRAWVARALTCRRGGRTPVCRPCGGGRGRGLLPAVSAGRRLHAARLRGAFWGRLRPLLPRGAPMGLAGVGRCGGCWSPAWQLVAPRDCLPSARHWPRSVPMTSPGTRSGPMKRGCVYPALRAPRVLHAASQTKAAGEHGFARAAGRGHSWEGPWGVAAPAGPCRCFGTSTDQQPQPRWWTWARGRRPERLPLERGRRGCTAWAASQLAEASWGAGQGTCSPRVPLPSALHGADVLGGGLGSSQGEAWRSFWA